MVINPHHPYHLLANSMVLAVRPLPAAAAAADPDLVQGTHLRAGGLTWPNRTSRHADRRRRLHRPRHRDQAPRGRHRRLRHPRARRPRRRHLARQHVSRCGLRHPVAAVLVLVREEPGLVAGLLTGRRDLPPHRGPGRRFDLRTADPSSASRSTGWPSTRRRASGRRRPGRKKYRARTVVLASGPLPDHNCRTSAASTPTRATRSTAPVGTTTTTSPASGWRSSAPAPARCRSCPSWSSRPPSSRSSSARRAGCCPGWTSPRRRRHRSCSRKCLPLNELARQALFWGHEATATALVWDTPLTALVARLGKAHLRRQVKDPWLRRQLTPDFTPGASGC